MQGKSKAKKTQKVALLDSTAKDGVLAKTEQRLGPITALHPGR